MVINISVHNTVFEKNLNASKPSEHPPQVEECSVVVVVVFFTLTDRAYHTQ